MSEGFEIARVSTIEKTHKMLRRAETDEYGPFKIFKHHATDELVLVKEKTTNSKIELTHEISSVERRYNFRHPNLLDMVDWSVDKKSQMCATFYRIKTFFKFHPTTLNMLISKRRKEGNMLDDTEIMQLTYDGVDALGYLQSQNVSHGYIRPELIAVESNGQFVICDKLLEGTSRDAHLFAYRTKKDVYSSPAVWSEMVNDSRLRHNGYKDDAFSFGLVLLYAANLVPPQDIYDRTGRINEGNLERHISQATAKYDNVPLFGQILKKMLSLNEDERWDFLTLMSSMPTRQQIQYYFTNYNNDEYFEDPEFIQSSRMNATNVMNEYSKMALGEHLQNNRTTGLDPLTGKLVKDEYTNRYNLGGTQASNVLNGTGISTGGRFSNTIGGNVNSHHDNPQTRKNLMRDRVKAPEQFNVPRPGNIDYSIAGDKYVNMKHNQTMNNMTVLSGPRDTQNFTTTTYKDPNDVTYDFDGQKNKHAVRSDEVSGIQTPSYMGNFSKGDNRIFTSGHNHIGNAPPSEKKQSLKTFLDNFANQPESQRISQNTHNVVNRGAPIPQQHRTPVPPPGNFPQGIPQRRVPVQHPGQGQTPILQTTQPKQVIQGHPQYRQQVASHQIPPQNQQFRPPNSNINGQLSANGNVGYNGYGAIGRTQNHTGQERGFVDPTKIGK